MQWPALRQLQILVKPSAETRLQRHMSSLHQHPRQMHATTGVQRCSATSGVWPCRVVPPAVLLSCVVSIAVASRAEMPERCLRDAQRQRNCYLHHDHNTPMRPPVSTDAE